MFKVICIDDSDNEDGFPADTDFWPKVGERYEVIDEGQGKGVSGIFIYSYVLSVDPEWSYPAKMFIPVSNIDEKEFERNYNLQQKEITL